MGWYRKRRTGLVVSPSPWSINTVLLVTVFVVTSALVYYWGYPTGRDARSKPRFTAAASIRHAELPDETDAGRRRSPSDDLAALVEGQIRSRDALEAAARAATPSHVPKNAARTADHSPAATLERLQKGLAVEVEEGGAGQRRVRIRYTGTDAHRAAELLEAVARQYVDTFRREWQQQTETAHAQAATAAEQARLAWQLAEAERREFVARLLREQQHEAPATPPRPGDSQPSAEPAPPTQAENPEWSHLAEQRARLERRRADLLFHRTPEHPEVQQIDYDLAELQRTLASTPRWIGREASREAGDAATKGATHPSDGQRQAEPPMPEQPEMRRQLEQLDRKADQARSRYEELAAAERAAWSVHLREPAVELTYLPAVEGGSRSLTADHAMSTSLLAGLAMMVGVGMFAGGAAMEPTLRSTDQIQSLLRVPVVATVTLPGLKPVGSGWPRVWLRLATCVGGAVLIAGCVGLLYRAMAG